MRLHSESAGNYIINIEKDRLWAVKLINAFGAESFAVDTTTVSRNFVNIYIMEGFLCKFVSY